jgi:hypothetical protein
MIDRLLTIRMVHSSVSPMRADADGVACREMIEGLGAVEPLTDLLISDDVQVTGHVGTISMLMGMTREKKGNDDVVSTVPT